MGLNENNVKAAGDLPSIAITGKDQELNVAQVIVKLMKAAGLQGLILHRNFSHYLVWQATATSKANGDNTYVSPGKWP